MRTRGKLDKLPHSDQNAVKNKQKLYNNCYCILPFRSRYVMLASYVYMLYNLNIHDM